MGKLGRDPNQRLHFSSFNILSGALSLFQQGPVPADLSTPSVWALATAPLLHGFKRAGVLRNILSIHGERPQENFRLPLQNRIFSELYCRMQIKKNISHHNLRVWNHEAAARLQRNKNGARGKPCAEGGIKSAHSIPFRPTGLYPFANQLFIRLRNAPALWYTMGSW